MAYGKSGGWETNCPFCCKAKAWVLASSASRGCTQTLPQQTTRRSERGSSIQRPPPGSRSLPALPPPRGPRPSPGSPGEVRRQAAGPPHRATKTGSARPRLSALDYSWASVRSAPCSQTANQRRGSYFSYRLPSVAADCAELQTQAGNRWETGVLVRGRPSREGTARRLSPLLPWPSPTATHHAWCHVTLVSFHRQCLRKVFRFSCISSIFDKS